MSDNIIPSEIHAEILKRLPIKPLIQFKTVSKPWKSLIDSSKFIADFNLCHTEPHQLFVSYHHNIEQKHVSFVDDNTFPQHKLPLTKPILSNTNHLINPIVVGSSQGLFCLYGPCYDINSKSVLRTKTAVIWNPSIRKSVCISVPDVLPYPYETVIVFGVCPLTNHPKLVKSVFKKKVVVLHIGASCTYPQRESIPISIPPRVEVCTSKSRVWRTISTDVSSQSIELTKEHVAINRHIYWLGYDRNSVGGKIVYCNLIVLFDITNEEFTQELKLPDGLQGGSYDNVRISKLRDSLIMLKTDTKDGKQVYDVWMMENSVAKTFRKLYTIKAPNASITRVLGFRKSGEPIIDMRSHPDERTGLFVYDSDTEQFNSIGLSGQRYSYLASTYVDSYFASSYVDSLLLLDH